MSSRFMTRAILTAIATITLGCAQSSDSETGGDDAAATAESAAEPTAEPVDAAALEKAAADLAAEIETQITAGAAGHAWRFGQSDVECEELTAAVLNASPADYADVKVRIRGTVAAVCQARGCWVQVEDSSGEALFAKSFDHRVLMPKNCEGMEIDVVGTMYADPVEDGEEQTYSFSLDGATLVAPEG